MQVIQMSDFENPTMLTKTDELFNVPPPEQREMANKLVRLLIRGKQL